MAKMQRIMDGQRVVGAVVQHKLHDNYARDPDAPQGVEYLVYVTPAIRRDPLAREALMQGVEASLQMQGIEESPYWGHPLQ